MPKSTTPSNLQAGIGQEPFTQANYTLTVGGLSPNNILSVSPAQKHDAGVDPTFMLMSHVQDPHAAHPASAVSVADVPPEVFTSDNVQGVLQELAGTLPYAPSNVGEWRSSFPLTTGIPDWGVLGLNTGALTGFDLASGTTTPALQPSHRYPYQWVPPTPGNRTNLSQYGPFEPPPASTSNPPTPAVYFEFNQSSDLNFAAYWNAGGFAPRDTVFNVASGVYTGGGSPEALAGGFTRAATGDLVQTYRVLHKAPTANAVPVVVTGMVAPADRGVLALIHWPAGGLMADFLAQTGADLKDSVIAAILLGQGLYGAGNCPVDGEVGGIFLKGTTNGAYDPYAWPGQGTGQAGLAEIYRGVASCFSDQTFSDTTVNMFGPDNYIFAKTSPYWNFDGRVSAPLTISATVSLSPNTTQITVTTPHNYKAGQPITVDGCPDINGGSEITAAVDAVIGPNDFSLFVVGVTNAASSGTTQRITGCDVDDYPADGIPFPAQVRLGTVADAGVAPVAGGIPILGAPYLEGAVRGSAVPTGTGNTNNNFFQYRLPILTDYSNTPTGLKYTPVLEKPRYYTKPAVADNANPLTNAGNFTGYPQDYYPYQVARFRHRFEIPCPADFNDLGSYMLLHFKKELYFEDLIVRGIWPTDDKLYSANVTNVADINAGTAGLDDVQNSTAVNMIDQTALSTSGWVNGSINGKPFFNLCGSVVIDKTDIAGQPPVFAAAPTFNMTTYPAGTMDGWIHTVSGVGYFAAKDDNDSRAIRLDRFALTANRMFDDAVNHRAFLTGNPDGSFSPSRIMTLTPLMMHLGDFMGLTQYYTVTPSLGTSGIWPHAQHTEFDIEAISAGAIGGAGPAIGSAATLPSITVEPTGDATGRFIFSSNAKPHAFLRTPLSHSFLGPLDGVNLADSPIAFLGGDKVLFSGCTRDPLQNPAYGNLVDPLAPVPVPPLWPAALTSLFGTTKTYEEHFLDEVFRYASAFGFAIFANLSGPGLPNPPAPIEIPSKAGIAVDGPAPTNYPWPTVSWFQCGTVTAPYYKADLSLVVPNELQVAGAPHRNPPISEGVYAPKPECGVLVYPKTTYSTGYRPNLATDGVTQFDYKIGVFDRSYARVLDLAQVGVQAGTPFAILQFKGLTLEDFAYAGGATAGSANIAILAKVPGLTTWMDVGRVDGAGPSKQDPLLDGAGCQVLGPDTKNLTDPEYGYPIAQVKINVGPVANFFKCVLDGQCEDEIPLLIKVLYYCPHAIGTITVRNNADVTNDQVVLDDNVHAPTTLTEGVDFAAGGTAADTATNIAAAINAVGAGLDISAFAWGSIVYLMADVFGTSGTACNVQVQGRAPLGLEPTVQTFFTGGCDSDKYDLTYQVTSAAGVTPVTFNATPGEDFKSAEVRGLYTIAARPLA